MNSRHIGFGQTAVSRRLCVVVLYALNGRKMWLKIPKCTLYTINGKGPTIWKIKTQYQRLQSVYRYVCLPFSQRSESVSVQYLYDVHGSTLSFNGIRTIPLPGQDLLLTSFHTKLGLDAVLKNKHITLTLIQMTHIHARMHLGLKLVDRRKYSPNPARESRIDMSYWHN